MSHGKFVAASTITTLLGSSLQSFTSYLTQSIRMTKWYFSYNSLTYSSLYHPFELEAQTSLRREASCSDSDPLLEHRESISSMKIVLGA